MFYAIKFSIKVQKESETFLFNVFVEISKILLFGYKKLFSFYIKANNKF